MLISRNSNALYRTSIAHYPSDEIALATELSFVVHPSFYFGSMPSCDGLILIRDGANKMWLVNPTTKESRELPIPSYGIGHYPSLTVYGLGYDHVNDDYKVVSLADGNMCVSVYSVRSDKWKQVESSPYCNAQVHNVSGVLVGGIIHWITSEYSTPIVGYDLIGEKLCVVQTPNFTNFIDYVFHHLMELGGCLSMFGCPSRVCPSYTKGIDVWVMKEYGVTESWTKFSIVDQETTVIRPLSYMSRQWVVMKVKDEETGDSKLVMYHLDTGTSKDISVHGIIDEFDIGGSYSETLVSPYYNYETQRG